MSATIAENHQAPVRRRLTVKDFQRMAETGILGKNERVELIDGELIAMPPIGPKHADIVNYITRIFARHLGDDKLVTIQNPVHLDRYGEVYPDATIVRNRRYFHAHPLPRDVLLIIEVSDSTLGYDRDTKLPHYAVHGIGEVWLINVPERCVELYRQPHSEEQRYQNVQRVERGTVAAQAIPEVRLPLSELFLS
jgi:Uma2 family endonuclease